MALDPNALKAAMEATIYNTVWGMQESKIDDLDPSSSQKEDVRVMIEEIAKAISETAADIITEFLTNAEITVTIPPASFLVGATAPVFNPAAVPITGTISG